MESSGSKKSVTFMKVSILQSIRNLMGTEGEFTTMDSVIWGTGGLAIGWVRSMWSLNLKKTCLKCL